MALPHGQPAGGLVDTQPRQSLRTEALSACADLAFKSPGCAQCLGQECWASPSNPVLPMAVL